MMMKKMLAMLLSCGMLLGLCACGGSDSGNSDGSNGGEVKYAEWVYYGHCADLDSADPYGSTSGTTEWFTNMTFDTVIYNNSETGGVDPELAYKWEANEDNTEWTFWLHENVYFHNGDHMTAEDVKFTYLYAANLNGEVNVVKTFAAGSYASEVEIIDDYTIKFVLKQPMPDFPSYMEMKVYSKNAIESLGHAEGSVIGTGPYYFDRENTVSGQLFVATRNDNYWNGIENYKTKHLGGKIIGNANALMAALQAGEIDFCTALNRNDFNIVKEYPGLKTEQRAGCESYYLGFNYSSKNADMNDLEIRRAIAQCIDKDAIVQIAFNGLAEKSVNFCAPSGLGYSEEVRALEYNPEAGAATLKEKGVTKLTLVYNSYGAFPVMAEVIQACLAKAGVEVTLRLIDTTNWTTFKAAQDGYDLFIDYASYRGALLYNYNRFLYRGGSSNVFGYECEEYEILQDKVSAQTSWNDMLKVFGELQQWTVDNVPLFPIAYNHMLLSKNENVSGGYLGGSDNSCDWSTIYKIVK